MTEPLTANADILLQAGAADLALRGRCAVAVVQDGRVIASNAAFTQVFQMDAVGRPFAELAVPAARTALSRALSGENAEVAFAFAAVRADGSIFEVEAAGIHSVLACGLATVLNLADVSSRSPVQRPISHGGLLDTVTGLPNRTLLLERLRDTMATPLYGMHDCALLVCGVQGMPAVREGFRRAGVDIVVATLASRLTASVRSIDTVARIGAEEFAVLLAASPPTADVDAVAQRILDRVAEPILIEQSIVHLGMGIGIAHFSRESQADSAASLFTRAEIAMHTCRASGQNRTLLCEQDQPLDRVPVRAFIDRDDMTLVGIEIIDKQHQALADLINALQRDLQAGRTRDRIIASLAALVQFAKLHFDTEEQLMALHAPMPAPASHADEHHRLMEDIRIMTVEVQPDRLVHTMNYLREWLLRHINTLDKPLGVALRHAGVK